MNTLRDMNRRETGRRIPKARTDDAADAEFSQKAAENRKPRGGVGLSEPAGETEAATRKSDGVKPAKTRKGDVIPGA